MITGIKIRAILSFDNLIGNTPIVEVRSLSVDRVQDHGKDGVT